MAVITEIGDGTSTIFWKDKLLLEQHIEDLAPHLFEFVPKRANKRMVLETLTNHQCIHDLQGALTEGAIADFLTLWDLIAELQLQ